MIYNRYSTDPNPQWLLVGERNEFIAILQDCFRGKKGQVVKEHWSPGKFTYEVVGKCERFAVNSGGPMWGQTPTLIHRLQVTLT